jgi:hypothetical protein
VKVGKLDDPIWEQPADDAVRPLDRQSRIAGRRLFITGRRLFIIGVVVVFLAGALAFWFSRPTRSGGDPGGQILAQLRPVARAVPRTAAVVYAHFDEPSWDSWDGMAGTFGWTDVVSQIHFTWSSTPSTLITYTGDELTKLGWGSYSQIVENGVPGGEWTKELDNGTLARIQLGADPGGGWTLFAQAPPVGPRV